METKKPRGRPPLKTPATAQIHVRVTPAEKARYRKAAGKQGISKWLKALADRFA
jgi:hypothetical protein